MKGYAIIEVRSNLSRVSLFFFLFNSPLAEPPAGMVLQPGHLVLVVGYWKALAFLERVRLVSL